MRVKYFPRTEYDHVAVITWPRWLQIGNEWTFVTGILFAGALFIHTGLEVR